MEQEIRFCTTSDGVRIAYATVGQGPPLVLCSGVYSDIEAEWQLPWRRAWYERLAQSCTLVRYDKRGTGLSQRGAFEYSADILVADLEATVGHLGLERSALGGIMLGGVTALLYTIRHPDRVSRLVLYGAASGGTDLADPKVIESVVAIARSNWPMASVLVSNLSTGAVSAEVQKANESFVQAAVDGETFARLIEMGFSLDLRPLLSRVIVPALVIHEQENRVIPVEFGRRLAAHLPNARFVALEGDSSTPFHNRSREATVDTIIDFLRESQVSLDGLTGREVQVLRLIAGGRSNREIGAELIISANTVDRHVSHILSKTRTANRAEAAAYSVRNGLA